MKKKLKPRCGECKQLLPVKYRRTITKKMALGLLVLVLLHEKTGSWIHVTHPAFKGLTSGGDLAKLAHFGLIEAKRNASPQKKSASGLWRPTETGKAFARGEVTVPYVALIRQREFLGFDDTKRRHIQEALGKEFLLADLLAGAIYTVVDQNDEDDKE